MAGRGSCFISWFLFRMINSEQKFMWCRALYYWSVDIDPYFAFRTQPTNEAGVLSPTTSNGAERATGSREHTSSSRTSDLGAAPITGKNPNRSQIPELVPSKPGKKVGRVRDGSFVITLNEFLILCAFFLRESFLARGAGVSFCCEQMHWPDNISCQN